MLLNSFKILKDRQKRFAWQNRRKSQHEKISVIIPVYNEKAYIADCLDSIRKQTYTNFEVIIVDDGSTDGTLSICEEISKRDARIALLAHDKNMGVADARNTGLAAATGEYIMFVNGDDMLDKNTLDTMKRACDVNKSDVCVCDIEYLYDGDIRKKSKYANGETEVVTGKEFDMCYFLYPDTVVENISAWNKLYSAALFSDTQFTNNKKYCDEATVFKLTNISPRVSYVHEALYISRVKLKGEAANEFSNEQYEIFDAFMDRLRFYESESQYDMMWYTLKKCMYWLYDFRNKARIHGCYDKKITAKYSKQMNEFYKKNKAKFEITSRDRKQIALFMTSFTIYCKIKDLQC